eukprot:2152651-Pleurochrysis_carterae.AAC.1
MSLSTACSAPSFTNTAVAVAVCGSAIANSSILRLTLPNLRGSRGAAPGCSSPRCPCETASRQESGSPAQREFGNLGTPSIHARTNAQWHYATKCLEGQRRVRGKGLFSTSLASARARGLPQTLRQDTTVSLTPKCDASWESSDVVRP